MQNKKGQVYIIAFIIILALAAFFFLRTTSPNEDADRADISGQAIKEINNNLGFQGVRDPVDTTKSHLSFTGYGPGKEHDGKFNDWNADLHIDDGSIMGFEGKIQADSATTDSSSLDKHLKNADFFNVEKFPTIKFASKSLSDNILTGDLTFLGKTKSITFPVKITEESLSADFVLDSSEFRDKDSETSKSSWLLKANDEVRIFFELFK